MTKPRITWYQHHVIYLLLAEDEVVELLLQDFVGIVDEELLEVVVREDLESFLRGS